MTWSAAVGGVVDERYIHHLARCLGSGERCTSRIAHSRRDGGGMVRPAGKARCFSAAVITFTRPRAWFLIIARLGNQRAISLYCARISWLLPARASMASCQSMATAVAVVVGGDFDRREGEVEWAVRAASGRVSRGRGGWTRNKVVESETTGFNQRTLTTLPAATHAEKRTWLTTYNKFGRC